MTSAGYGVCPLDKLVAAVFQWSRIGLRLPRPIDRKCPPEHSQPRHGGEHAERIPRRSQAVRRIDPARGAATRRPECVRPVDAPTAAASARASRKRACRAGCDPGPCEVLHRPVPHGRPAAAFDLGPQPDAPEEVRGEFKPTATNVPGLQLCELMPRTARQADKICVLRAMASDDNAHSSSGYYMLTGRPHQPKNFENANPGPPNDHPSLGGVVNKLRRGRRAAAVRHLAQPHFQHRRQRLAGPNRRLPGPQRRSLAVHVQPRPRPSASTTSRCRPTCRPAPGGPSVPAATARRAPRLRGGKRTARPLRQTDPRKPSTCCVARVRARRSNSIRSRPACANAMGTARSAQRPYWPAGSSRPA